MRHGRRTNLGRNTVDITCASAAPPMLQGQSWYGWTDRAKALRKRVATNRPLAAGPIVTELSGAFDTYWNSRLAATLSCRATSDTLRPASWVRRISADFSARNQRLRRWFLVIASIVSVFLVVFAVLLLSSRIRDGPCPVFQGASSRACHLTKTIDIGFLNPSHE